MFTMLGSCNDASLESDRIFIKSLKANLQQEGDSKMVSLVYPGNWLEVCIHNRFGFSADHTTIDKGEIINRSRGDTYADDEYWGIYFIYPKDKIEYFKIPMFEIFPKGLDTCHKKNNAYFEVYGDYYNRQGISNSAVLEKDFIQINIKGKDDGKL